MAEQLLDDDDGDGVMEADRRSCAKEARLQLCFGSDQAKYWTPRHIASADLTKVILRQLSFLGLQ